MAFLDAGRVGRGDDQGQVHQCTDGPPSPPVTSATVTAPRALPASSARRTLGERPLVLRRQHHIAGLSERFHLAAEHLFVGEVVRHASQHRRIGGQGEGRQGGTLGQLEAPDQLSAKCWASAAEPPLPQMSILCPARKAAAMRRATSAAGSANVSAACCFTAALSWKWRRTISAWLVARGSWLVVMVAPILWAGGWIG